MFGARPGSLLPALRRAGGIMPQSTCTTSAKIRLISSTVKASGLRLPTLGRRKQRILFHPQAPKTPRSQGMYFEFGAEHVPDTLHEHTGHRSFMCSVPGTFRSESVCPKRELGPSQAGNLEIWPATAMIEPSDSRIFAV